MLNLSFIEMYKMCIVVLEDCCYVFKLIVCKIVKEIFDLILAGVGGEFNFQLRVTCFECKQNL